MVERCTRSAQWQSTFPCGTSPWGEQDKPRVARLLGGTRIAALGAHRAVLSMRTPHQEPVVVVRRHLRPEAVVVVVPPLNFDRQCVAKASHVLDGR